jgi:ubiquinone biosynthesis protein COQ9
MTDRLDQQRDQLVEAMLQHVPFDGWTWQALEAGAADLGLDKGLERIIFTDGLVQAADHYADLSDTRMLSELKGQDLNGMRIRDRIHACVKARLIANARHKEAIGRLMSFLALPHNTWMMMNITWRTCSKIWYAAGDTSTDWNYYSKRTLLITVYSSTILYWIADKGDGNGDFPETWAFLDRRIDDVLKTFGLPKRIGGRLSRILSTVGIFRNESV